MMVLGNELTGFEAELLRDVVSLYIQDGKPVSSKALKGFYGLDASTANIRKVLNGLERKGYIFKPHISAGRIPSDKAYRLYVDGMKTVKTLDTEFISAIQRRIGQDWRDIRDVMSQTSRLLGELTNYMGLIMGGIDTRVILGKLRIVQLEGSTGLVILTLVPLQEKRVRIEFPKKYTPYILDRAVQIINERIAGHYLEEAVERLAAFLRENAGIEREIAEALTSRAEVLFEQPYDMKYYFKGSEEQVELFELDNLKTVQKLVRIMGEETLIRKVLQRRMMHDYMITIGSENELEELDNFAIITHRFSTGSCGGLIGILGPTRMSYSLVLSLLRRMAEELHQLDLR